MDVARVEAERDPPVRRVEHARAALDGPVARESPLVEPQLIRQVVRARLVALGSAGGREVLSLPVPEVGLGTLQVRPVRLSFEAFIGYGDEVVRDSVAAGLAEQPLDDHLALRVAALAELVVADPPFRVGDVHRGPVVVVEGAPDRKVGVERDRILDAHVLRGPTDVVGIVLERELRGVDANDDQPLILVLLVPRTDIARACATS